jgi:hypothetical protein
MAIISHLSHGFAAAKPAKHEPGKPNLARDASRGKHVAATAVHSAMTRQQRDGMQTGGRGHAVTAGGIPGSNPLAKPPLPKSHNFDLGAAILREAALPGSPKFTPR